MSGHPIYAFVNALRARNAKCVDFLRRGHGNAGAATRAAFPDLALPDEVIEFWSAFDGVEPLTDTPLGEIWIDGMFYFLSEAEAIEDYRAALSAQAQEGFPDYWPIGFFPLATPGDGSRLLVNCIAGSPSHGAIYELAYGEGVLRQAGSLARYFETMLACLEEDALSVDLAGRVEPNFARMREIAHEMNPNCDGWDDNMTPAYESKDWRA